MKGKMIQMLFRIHLMMQMLCQQQECSPKRLQYIVEAIQEQDLKINVGKLRYSYFLSTTVVYLLAKCLMIGKPRPVVIFTFCSTTTNTRMVHNVTFSIWMNGFFPQNYHSFGLHTDFFEIFIEVSSLTFNRYFLNKC